MISYQSNSLTWSNDYDDSFALMRFVILGNFWLTWFGWQLYKVIYILMLIKMMILTSLFSVIIYWFLSVRIIILFVALLYIFIGVSHYLFDMIMIWLWLEFSFSWFVWSGCPQATRCDRGSSSRMSVCVRVICWSPVLTTYSLEL